MRLAWAIAIISCSSLTVGCANHVTAPTDVVPMHDVAEARLKEDLGREEFTRALIGEWVSAWDDPSRDFVRSLTLTGQGMATVTIQERYGEQRVVAGPYAISFVRPPAQGSVTLADIAIVAPSGEKVVLARVSFGLHNAVLGGPYMRVDRSPRAVLKRKGS